MKCPICNGSGIDNRCDRLSCYECGGSGEVQTNEEWLKSMDTEQFAEALAWIEDRGELPTVRNENVKAFKEWLKQPHQKE